MKTKEEIEDFVKQKKEIFKEKMNKAHEYGNWELYNELSNYISGINDLYDFILKE